MGGKEEEGEYLTPIFPDGFLLNSQIRGLGCIEPFPTLNTDSGVKCSEGTERRKVEGANRGDTLGFLPMAGTPYLAGRGRQDEWRQWRQESSCL